MARLVISLLVLALFGVVAAPPARADLIIFEAGNRSNEKRMTWDGKFEGLDRSTGIVRFTFSNAKKRPTSLRIHLSRIYRLAIDNRVARNQDFPMAAPSSLAIPLPGNLEPPQRVELSNRGLIMQDLPPGVRMQYFEGTERIQLAATIYAADTMNLTIVAKAQGANRVKFDVGRGDLLLWQR